MALEKLSIPSDTGRVYIDVVRTGRMPMAALRSAYSGKHRDLVQSLTWLQDNGMVLFGVDALGRKEILALDPRIAIRSYYARLLWRHVPLEERLSTLSGKESQAIHRFRCLCLRMEQELCKIYCRPDVQVTTAYYEPEETSNALSMTLNRACREILGITLPPWEPSISVIWQTIIDRISAGVRYRRVSDEVTFVCFGHSINERDILRVGVQLRLLNHENILDKFFIVDDNEVFAILPHLTDDRSRLGATYITTKALVEGYAKVFEGMWRKGVPGRAALDHMTTARKSFVSRCCDLTGNAGEQLAEALFDFGKFCLPQHIELPADTLSATIKTLAEHSLLSPSNGSELGFVPNVFDELRAFIASYELDKEYDGNV